MADSGRAECSVTASATNRQKTIEGDYMRLKALKLKNFRGYVGETTIVLDDLTVLVGRNDAGKSTVLEALAIFFDDDSVKFDAEDLCKTAADREVRIGCVLDELPPVVVDSSVETTLAAEHLLNGKGELEIHRTWSCTKKTTPECSIVAIAEHPTAKNANDLLQLKQVELKKRCDDLGVTANRTKNAEMRAGIRDKIGKLDLAVQDVPLNDAGGRDIWNALQPFIPVFAIFKSDRPSVDQDPEVQDPMNAVVKAVMKQHEATLQTIQTEIETQVREVAARTLEKLCAFDPELAETLEPVASKSSALTAPKFSLTDGRVPVNKRGSGTRRLVLLSFFQAEAEGRCAGGQVIYAIEEPETSQHPSNVTKIMGALMELSRSSGVQVVLTTHVPALAGMAPPESLRHVVRVDGVPEVRNPSQDVLKEIAEDLGVLPEPFNGVRVVVCVEGPNDVACIRRLMALAASASGQVDPSADRRVLFLPAGGSSLKAWVNEHYLEALGLAEVHVYDRDDAEPRYGEQVKAVNNRADSSCAFSTERRELENYLHPSAISSVLDVDVVVDSMTDVPIEVAKSVRAKDPNAKQWDELTDADRRRKENQVKRQLNGPVAEAMTAQLLEELGVLDEVLTWVCAVSDRLA